MINTLIALLKAMKVIGACCAGLKVLVIPCQQLKNNLSSQV